MEIHQYLCIYFHENQLSYPWSPRDRDIKKNRDSHYGFINYASALCADKVFFNSKFHLTSYLNALEKFLNTFPDQREISTVATIKNKSEVLQLGLDLSFFDKYHIKNNSSFKFNGLGLLTLEIYSDSICDSTKKTKKPNISKVFEISF